MLFFDPFIYRYDIKRFDFVNAIGEILNLRRLEMAHRIMEVSLATRETDQKTKLHEIYYDSSKQVFFDLYNDFLRDVVAPRLRQYESIVYQAIPNLRVHMPGSMAVGEFHKDSKYAHSVHEVNVWVPLTKTMANNTIWIESQPDKADFKPVLIGPGECLMFQGALLTHGNRINNCTLTRISFDFRVMRLADYESEIAAGNLGGKSVNTKTRLEIGQYFECMKLTADELCAGAGRPAVNKVTE